jgi:L-amino acid N-acyltransferase YncA
VEHACTDLDIVSAQMSITRVGSLSSNTLFRVHIAVTRPVVIVRDASDADMSAVTSIYARHVLHGLASFEEVPPSLDEMKSRRAAVLQLGLPYLVAELDGRVVGFMLGEVRSGEFGLEEPTGWIEVLGVDPDHRGRAVGRQMALAMLEHFRQQGARSVRTLVDEGMGGIARFFESLGFEPAGLRPFVRTL